MVIKINRITNLLNGIRQAASPAERRQWSRRFHGVDPTRDADHAVLEAALTVHFEKHGLEVVNWPAGIVDMGISDGATTGVVQFNRWRTATTEVGPVAQLHRAAIAFEAMTAVMISAGYFSLEAEDYAREHGLTLIDGEGLQAILLAYAPAYAPAYTELVAVAA